MSVIKFNPMDMERIGAFLEAVPEIDSLTAQELEQYRAQTQQMIADLDAL